MKNHTIKKCIIPLLLTGLMFFSTPGFCAQDFDKVSGEINQEASRATKDAAFTASLVKKDKKELTAILKKIKAGIKKEQTALDALKDEFKTLSLQELELTKQLDTEYQEVQDVEGSVRGTLKDAVSMVRDNPITAQDTQRSTMVNAMMDSKKFPGMKGIQSLVDLYFDELDKGSKIVSYNGEFIGVDGKINQGQIIRAGRFTAYVKKSDGSVGFLKPEPDGERLIAVAGEIPKSTQKAMDSYFAKAGDVLPIDPSGGALLLIIERLIVLGTTKANTDKIMERMNEAAQNNEWDECQIICEENKRVPTCSMLGSAMTHIGSTQEVLENALQEGILRQMPKLERFLPTMGVLAAIAPLMGLLGTVTGMINIFRVITVVGTGDPRVMSGGISEALLTTQFGLAVAIPLMIIHHMLERRVDRIVGDMEEKGTAFAVTLIKHGAITENEAQSV